MLEYDSIYMSERVDVENTFLTLFRMGEGGNPYQFFPCNFYKRNIWPTKLSYI